MIDGFGWPYCFEVHRLETERSWLERMAEATSRYDGSCYDSWVAADQKDKYLIYRLMGSGRGLGNASGFDDMLKA